MPQKPETILQKSIMDYMRLRGWECWNTHGSQYQMGFPDFYTAHFKYGTRWVEVKLPHRKVNPFTPAQMKVFQEFAGKGVGIWVLTAASSTEYNKLFKPSNWYTFLGVMQ